MFREKFKRSPSAWNLADLKDFLALGESVFEKLGVKEEEKGELIKLLTKFSLSC